MKRVSDLPRRVAKQVDAVCSRTFTSALWNAELGEIHFYLGEPNSGVWQQKIERDKPWSDGTVDYVTRTIQRARMSAREKDRQMEAFKTSEASDLREQKGVELEDRKREMASTLRRARNRRDMGKHFKGGAVVSGLKGESK